MPGPQPCHCIPFIFCIVGRGLDPSGGVGDAAPYNNPQGFSLPQTSAAAWGQAALHPTLPHSVGRAFAHNSFTPPRRGWACPARSLAHCIPFIFCIAGRGLDPSGGVGDAAPYILGRELSANRRGIHLSRFLARVSLRQHRIIPALRLKHRSGGCGTASALPKCSIIHKVLSALLA